MKFLFSFLFLFTLAVADEAPLGVAVEPTPEEQKALSNLHSQISGLIVWSSSRTSSTHNLWRMNADGSNKVMITKSKEVDWFPRISPDGKTVLFNRSKGGWVPENDAKYPEKWNVWVVGIDGKGEKKVAEDATWPTWGSNGKTIVFSRAGKVFTQNLQTQKETLLLDGEKAFDKKGVILQEPNLSTDGKYLAITLRGSMRETGIWNLAEKTWSKSGDGCQIDWLADESRVYRVNPTGNGGTAAPSEILWFAVKNGRQIDKVGFFGIPRQVKLMDLPGRRSHEYFPRISRDGKWLVWCATDNGHDHDIFDYEMYLWKIGTPVKTATRLTFQTGNDRWPDIWLGNVEKLLKKVASKGVPSSKNIETPVMPQVPSEPIRNFRTQKGQMLQVEETHPIGLSLSSIKVSTKRVPLKMSILIQTDPIKNTFFEDFNNDGSKDLLIVTQCIGSGSYGDAFVFILNDAGLLSMIPLNAQDPSMLQNIPYNGQDSFSVKNGILERQFPNGKVLRYQLKESNWELLK